MKAIEKLILDALDIRVESNFFPAGDQNRRLGYVNNVGPSGNNARLSKGLINSTTGMRDDPKQLQVSAEIQPGNSGGPLLDHEGQVIGIIQQTINPWRIAQATGGSLPQNVNFAIKAEPVLEFVKGS